MERVSHQMGGHSQGYYDYQVQPTLHGQNRSTLLVRSTYCHLPQVAHTHPVPTRGAATMRRWYNHGVDGIQCMVPSDLGVLVTTPDAGALGEMAVCSLERDRCVRIRTGSRFGVTLLQYADCLRCFLEQSTAALRRLYGVAADAWPFDRCYRREVEKSTFYGIGEALYHCCALDLRYDVDSQGQTKDAIDIFDRWPDLVDGRSPSGKCSLG
jgi:hypothetical protein